MFAAWQRFEEHAADLQGLKRGRLRLAAVTTTEYFLPDLLGPFARAHPGIDIELAVENRDAVVARLERGSDELAAMMLPPDHLALHRWPFMANPLVVVAAASHPLALRASHKRLPLTRLLNEPLLVREAGSGTRLALERVLAERAVAWPPRMALGSNEALKHAVRAGLGIAVLSRHTLATNPATEGLAVLPVTGFPIRRMWHLVWRRDRPLSLPARTLLACSGDAGLAVHNADVRVAVHSAVDAGAHNVPGGRAQPRCAFSAAFSAAKRGCQRFFHKSQLRTYSCQATLAATSASSM